MHCEQASAVPVLISCMRRPYVKAWVALQGLHGAHTPQNNDLHGRGAKYQRRVVYAKTYTYVAQKCHC